jgi:hypothetical protein
MSGAMECASPPAVRLRGCSRRGRSPTFVVASQASAMSSRSDRSWNRRLAFHPRVGFSGMQAASAAVAARLHFTFNQLEYFLFEPFGRRYQAELLKWGRRETIPPILQISDSLRF